MGPFSPVFPLHFITISLSRLSTSHWVIVISLPAHSGHPSADSQQKRRRHPLQQNNSLGVLEESDPPHAPAYLFGTGRLSSPQSLNCNRLLHNKSYISSGESLLVAGHQQQEGSTIISPIQHHMHATYLWSIINLFISGKCTTSF